MSPGDPGISVVIPTLNRPDSLPRVIRALAGQSAADRIELIVVEDANNETPVDLTGLPFEARTLRAEERGASHARNVGWRAARHELVLFLGDDIIAAPDLVARHLRLHEQHPSDDVGVLGDVVWARELKRDAFMIWLDQGIQFAYQTIDGTEAGPGHFYSSNVSVKRAKLDAVGGFDAERFPFLYEDIDLGRRLFQQGFRLIYDEGAVGEHLHHPSLERWRKRMVVQAQAERAWIERYPEEAPYFKTRFEAALAMRPRRGAFKELLRVIPRDTKGIGHRVWRNADTYFRQQLGKPFVEAWNSYEGQRPGHLPPG